MRVELFYPNPFGVARIPPVDLDKHQERRHEEKQMEAQETQPTVVVSLDVFEFLLV